jgi:hypothetical protein
MLEPGDKIRVSFYSGYKGEETPRALFIEGQEHPIEEILERRRIEDRTSGQTFDLFVCKAAGKILKIRMEKSGECEIIK